MCVCVCVCVCVFRGVLSGQWEPRVNPTLPCVLYTRVAQRVIPEFLALEFYQVGGGGHQNLCMPQKLHFRGAGLLQRVCKPLPWALRGLRPGQQGKDPHGICLSEKPLGLCGVELMGRRERNRAASDAPPDTRVVMPSTSWRVDSWRPTQAVCKSQGEEAWTAVRGCPESATQERRRGRSLGWGPRVDS